MPRSLCGRCCLVLALLVVLAGVYAVGVGLWLIWPARTPTWVERLSAGDRIENVIAVAGAPAVDSRLTGVANMADMVKQGAMEGWDERGVVLIYYYGARMSVHEVLLLFSEGGDLIRWTTRLSFRG